MSIDSDLIHKVLKYMSDNNNDKFLDNSEAWSETSIKIGTVAETLGITDTEAELAIANAIMQGKIIGRIDQQKGVLNCNYVDYDSTNKNTFQETKKALITFRDTIIKLLAREIKNIETGYVSEESKSN